MARILHLRSSRSVAGPERQILELARALRGSRQRLEIAVLSRRESGDVAPHPFVAELDAAGVPVVEIPDPDRMGRTARRDLLSRFGRDEIGIVHSHDPKANWVARGIRRHAALVATVHLHTRTTTALRLHAWIDRWSLRQFDRLIAVSESAAASLRGRGGETPRIIANGLDADELVQRLASERAGNEPGARSTNRESPAATLVLAGRLTPQKGVDLMIRALPRILASHPGTRLVIAGDGPERAALAGLAEHSGVAGAIIWLGLRRDVLSVMASATVFVHPSRFEGAPFAVLEAMALALPIVATAVGAVPEQLEHGAAGRLVAPEAVEELARATIELLGSSEQRRVLAERARQRVVGQYTARRMADETAALYREVLP